MFKPSELNRRTSREFILKALYAHELNQKNIQAITSMLFPSEWGEKIVYKHFIFSYLEKTTAHQKETDNYIKKHAKEWDISRIAIIDKLLMRMAITEFLYFNDIPPKVSINEALELAKKYGGHNSYSFINGILDSTMKDLTKSLLLKKSGRGLIDTSIKGKKPTDQQKIEA